MEKLYNPGLPHAHQDEKTVLQELEALSTSLPPPVPLTRQTAYVPRGYDDVDEAILTMLETLARNQRAMQKQLNQISRAVHANNHCVRDIHTKLNSDQASPQYCPTSPLHSNFQ
jgi:hypothetical protein